MKKFILVCLALLLGVFLFGCAKSKPDKEAQPPQISQQTAENDEAEVKILVENFGRKLQAVSLQAPSDTVNKSLQDNYSDFVSPALLAEWQKDPQNAPGRVVSSPWPDRIEVQSIKKMDSTYEVKGEIIEITSVEMAKGGVAARRPINLVAGKAGARWLITAVSPGEYQ